MAKQIDRSTPLFQVTDLCQYFNVGRGKVLKAVDHVHFTIYKGETLGLVGESGCGKSTTGRCLVKLYEPAAGTITYKGKDIFKYTREEEKAFRKNVQMIFQNPHSSLNPRMTVKDIIGSGMKLHGLATDKDVDQKVEAILKRVGLNRDHMSRFPHEFSGGQKQRIGIARALAVEPEFVICDEPISALDVSIQAQVLNMLKELQEEMGLTYLFIAHDLSVVKYISDRVIVMYLERWLNLPIPKSCMHIRCIRTRRCFCPRFRLRIRDWCVRRSVSWLRARFQARSTRRTAAVLPRDVRMRRRSAGRSCRNSGK